MRRALTETVGLEPPFHSSLLISPRMAGARSDISRQYRSHYVLMGLTDTLAVFFALLLAYQLRFDELLPTLDFWLLLLTVPLITPVVYLTMRLYRVHQFSTAEEFRRIIVAISLIISATVMISFWSKASFSRMWMLLSWGLGLVLALSVRRLWHWRVRRIRLEGKLTFRTLIVGANLEAERLAATMTTKELGFQPVGFVSGGMDDLLLDDQRVVGPVGRIRELIRETKADCLFVASSAVTPEDVVQIMKARRMENVEVRFTANLPTVLSSRLAPQTIGGVMTLSVNVLQLTRAQAAAKRACDVLISGLGLLALLPLFAVVAAAIKLTSPGPVVFRQERVGLRGRPFTLLKFRTMVVGADLLLDTLRERNEADGPLFKLRQDPRVTRVGDAPAPLLDRRAAPALERPQGRDEPGRAAAAAGRRGRPVRGVAARPARGPARHHRPVAGQRAQRAVLRGLRAPRPVLRRELVDRLRPVHPVQDRPAPGLDQGRVLRPRPCARSWSAPPAAT